jgi:hypothetical protein
MFSMAPASYTVYEFQTQSREPVLEVKCPATELLLH